MLRNGLLIFGFSKIHDGGSSFGVPWLLLCEVITSLGLSL